MTTKNKWKKRMRTVLGRNLPFDQKVALMFIAMHELGFDRGPSIEEITAGLTFNPDMPTPKVGE